jgi:hypothetical protein
MHGLHTMYTVPTGSVLRGLEADIKYDNTDSRSMNYLRLMIEL